MTPKDTSELRGRIASGSIVAIIANLLYLISRLVLTPVILAHVTLAEYGLWTFCFVVLSYAGMSAFGINNAYIKYTAEHYSSGNIKRITQLLSTGITVMSVASLVLFLVIFVAAPRLVAVFSIDPAQVELATFLIVGTASVFLIDLAFGAFRGVLEGLQEIALGKAIWLFTTVIEVVLILAFLFLDFGIHGVLYAYIIKTVADVVLTVFACFRKLPSLRLSPRFFTKSALHELFVFGGKIQVLGLLGIFMGSLDRMITTAMLGLEATGLFEVGRKFPFTARSVTGAASAPFLPAASYLGGWWQESPALSVKEKAWKYVSLGILSVIVGALGLIPWGLERAENYFTSNAFYLWGFVGAVLLAVVIPALRYQAKLLSGGEFFQADEVRRLYINGSRYVNIINVVLYGFVLATAPQLIFAWVGEGYEEAYGVCVAVAAMCLVHLSTLPCSSIMRGINRSGRELEAMISNLVLMGMWAPAWTDLYGLQGTVWAVTASTIVSSVHFVLRTNLAFRISFTEYFRRTVVPGLSPACVSAFLYSIFLFMPQFDRWPTLFIVLGAGIVYVLACLIVLRRYALSKEEWATLVGPFARFVR